MSRHVIDRDDNDSAAGDPGERLLDDLEIAVERGDGDRARALIEELRRVDVDRGHAARSLAAGGFDLLEGLHQPAFILEPEAARIRTANSAAATLLGFSRAELAAMTIQELHPFEMARFHDLAERTVAHGGWRARGLTCRSSDGRFIPAEIWASRIDLGARVGILAVLQDLRNEPADEPSDHVTPGDYQRLQHEVATQRYLLDYGPEMVLWVRTDGVIHYANRTAAETMDYARARLEGMAIWAIDARASADAFPDMVEQLRHRRRTRFETEMIRSDGSRFPASVTVQLARPGADEFLVSFSRDISDEVHAREDARKYLAELAHISRRTSMGEMASAISHEINQPLTAITSYARGCLRLIETGEQDDNRLRDGLARMLASSERAHEVVNKLREYVQDREPRRHDTDVTALLDDCAILLRPEARHHAVELTTHAEPDLPIIGIDAILVQQVIINLARNAIEAINSSGSSERRVDIRAETTGQGILIEVSDTGDGLDADQAANLFEPFYSTKGSGMGIGLALCRSIVESHGGRIWAEPQTASGACFRLTLPRVD